MLTTLMLTAALTLAPGQSSGLQLTNVRNTYGELGGTRTDNKFLPGDVLFVGFDIEGISIDDDGKVQYTMAMEVVDKSNKPIFKQDPADKTDYVPLGGTKLPARAFVTIGLDQEPGTYTLNLTVTDRKSKVSQKLTKQFEVARRDFGIVAVYTSIDTKGEIPAPTTGIIGQAVFIQFGIVGFDRQPDAANPKKPPQPNVTIEMTPVDDRGNPTLKKPETFTMSGGVDEKDGGFTLRFMLPMTRTGKFAVRLKATDNISKKSTTFDLPIAIVPSVN